MAERLIEQIGIAQEERILDLGCRDGWACRLLSRLSPEGAIVGVDLSDEMINLARRKSADADNILYTLGSAEEIPWAEDYFTHVLSIESAYYWHSPERASREIFRVTAWGGQVHLLMSFYGENPHTRHWAESAGERLHRKTADEWKELFELQGFRNVQMRRISEEEPIAGDFQPGELWRSREEKEQFHRIGALLLSAMKPDLPPPGPLSSRADPFQIMG